MDIITHPAISQEVPIFLLGINESRTQIRASFKQDQSGVSVYQVRGWRNAICVGSNRIFFWVTVRSHGEKSLPSHPEQVFPYFD